MNAKAQQTRTLTGAALELAEAGLWVFPCHKSKRPATTNGFKDAENDPAKVRALFEGSNGVLIGVATGRKSGVFVIDLDLYKGDEAQQYLNDLESLDLLPPTRVHKTKNGGLHYFYSSESGVYPNVVPSDGVDVKGDGGYVIWWSEEFGGEVLSSGVAPAPAALIGKLTSRQQESAGDSIEALKAKILRAEVFHDALARLAARYIAQNMSAGETVRLLIEALRGSVASSPHHARHERWRQLLADEGGEISRIVLTANKKFSSSGAADDLAEALAGKKSISSALFKEYASAGQSAEGLEKLLSGDVWPFDEQGYFAHENHDLMKQRFIMHPILCEGESVLIAAEPKTGKTAVSLTVALHVACGLNLGEGLKVSEPRSVLYFGLEGRRAIRLRIAAWRRWQEERGAVIPAHIPLFVVEAGQNLMDPEARMTLVRKVSASDAYFGKNDIPSLGAIFIDTFTKSMPGGDQNSVEDTSSVFDVVGMMRDNGVTASVVFIHHKGKNGTVRGSTNIEADPDCLTSIAKDGHEVVWHVDRARSVEEGGSYRFLLHNYDLGLSEQGYMINAPVVEATDFSVESSNSIADAKLINAVMNLIVGMGDGVHAIQAVIDTLHAAGFGPQSAVAKAKVKAGSKVAQAYFADLIPETGYAFGKKTVTRQEADGVITGLFIR